MTESDSYKRCCWYLGVFLEVIHIPFAIFYMALGSFWVPKTLYFISMGIILGLQIATLGCPLMPVIAWLKHQRYPDKYYFHGSITFFLYSKFGRWVAGPVIILFFIGLYVGSQYVQQAL